MLQFSIDVVANVFELFIVFVSFVCVCACLYISAPPVFLCLHIYE